MKQYIYSIIAICFCCTVEGQMDLGTHFMSNISQSNLTNPASFNDYKINVTLPSIYGGFYNSSLKLDEVLEKRGTTLHLDMDQLINQMDGSGMNLQTNFNVETFSFSIRGQRWQASLNHGVRVATHHHLPKELLQFAWGGNSQFIDQTINIAPSFNLLAYQEFGLGLGFKVSEQLTLGTRLKYLVGTATYSTSNAKANIYTDPDYYQWTAETDYLINTGGLPESDVEDWEFLNLDDFEPNFFGDNKGFAIDFGASLDLTKKLNIQTSILNIGKINWEDEVYNYHSQGDFTFEGLDFQPILDEGEFSSEEITDTLSSTFQFESSKNAFSTVLPSSFYLSGTYYVKPSLSVGALFYAQGFQSELTTAVAVNVKQDFGKIFSLGAQYAMVEGGIHNIGLSTTLKLGPVQLFATSDNIIPIFNPLTGQNVNCRVGLNLVFGKIKPKTEEMTEMEGEMEEDILKK